MARAFRLEVLLQLARDRLEVATQELQRLRSRWRDAESKLEQLNSYQAEYSGQLQHRLAGGLGALQLHDYRLFLDKLERAIQAQGEEVQRCSSAWEDGHRRWLELNQRQEALGVLKQRHQAQQMQREGKREQKEQDEFALKGGARNLP